MSIAIHPEIYTIVQFEESAGNLVCHLASDFSSQVVDLGDVCNSEDLSGNCYSIWAAWKLFSSFMPENPQKNLELAIGCFGKSRQEDLPHLSAMFGRPYRNPMPAIVRMGGSDAYAIGEDAGYPVFIWRAMPYSYVVSTVNRKRRQVETGILPSEYIL